MAMRPSPAASSRDRTVRSEADAGPTARPDAPRVEPLGKGCGGSHGDQPVLPWMEFGTHNGRDEENPRMMRIALDSSTLEVLDHLSVPLILCDESGRELGTFTPDRDHVPHEEDGRPALREPEPWAHLGASVGIYGYASDLE
jgi:hypothetical protein